MHEELKRVPVRLGTPAEIQKLSQQCSGFCAPVFNDVEKSRNDLLKQLSAQMPNIINVIQASNVADAYKVVGEITLQQGEDGLFSAVLRGETGQITQHVKLEQSASGVARAATFAYSALNAAVGQANMMAIAERLAAIETQLDEAKRRDFIDKCEAVDSACVGIQEVLCLADSDHRRQTILERRNGLRTALGTLRKYIKIEIEAMPEYRKKTYWEDLLSNWGGKKSTLPMKAKSRFEYVAKTLPVWCRGMSFLVMTDSYFDSKDPYPSARYMINGLREMLENSKLSNRVKYVPMMGGADPIELVRDFIDRIPEAERVFERMRGDALSKKMAIILS